MSENNDILSLAVQAAFDEPIVNSRLAEKTSEISTSYLSVPVENEVNFNEIWKSVVLIKRIDRSCAEKQDEKVKEAEEIACPLFLLSSPTLVSLHSSLLLCV